MLPKNDSILYYAWVLFVTIISIGNINRFFRKTKGERDCEEIIKKQKSLLILKDETILSQQKIIDEYRRKHGS